MRKIPISVRKMIDNERYFKNCCLCGGTRSKGARIEVHHNLIYAGRQTDSYFSLLPLCVECHRTADHTKIKDRLDWIMMGRAIWGDLQKYPKVNWKQKKTYLESKFGIIPSLAITIDKNVSYN